MGRGSIGTVSRADKSDDYILVEMFRLSLSLFRNVSTFISSVGDRLFTDKGHTALHLSRSRVRMLVPIYLYPSGLVALYESAVPENRTILHSLQH